LLLKSDDNYSFARAQMRTDNQKEFMPQVGVVTDNTDDETGS